MKPTIAVLALALLLPCTSGAQSDAAVEDSAVTRTALNYVEGWYEGNAARMEQALHPELAKRMVYTDPRSGRSQLNQMSAMTLVQYTARGGGNKTPKDRQMKDVTILDRYNNVAMVKVVAADWVDYLQEAKYNGEWKIVNVLWELKPKPATKAE